jgi:predicted metal-dependent hydrolase
MAQTPVLLAEELFFEVHELLEPAWLTAEGAERRILQGLIQAAAAWYHWSRGNLRGAMSLMSEAGAKLGAAPPRWYGTDLEEMRSAVSEWQRWLASGADGTPPRLPFR